MLEVLFSSRVRAKLLTTLYLFPGLGWNAREISKLLHENYSAVWKELNRLQKLGILASEVSGNSKSYHADPDCPIAFELRSIVLKTEGIGRVMYDRFSDLGGTLAAFVYGLKTPGKMDQQLGINLLVIGEPDREELASRMYQAEIDLNRPISCAVYTADEWAGGLTKEDPFISSVKESPKVFLVGSEETIAVISSLE